jgi:hypothetical protein
MELSQDSIRGKAEELPAATLYLKQLSGLKACLLFMGR